MWRGFGGMSVIMALITVTLYLKVSFCHLASTKQTFIISSLSFHLQDYSSVIPYITVILIFLFIIFYGGGPGKAFAYDI